MEKTRIQRNQAFDLNFDFLRLPRVSVSGKVANRLMRLLTQADIASFRAEKPAAAIHFDATWDAEHRALTRRAMADAEQALAGYVNFGEVDCDSEPELAKSIPILNVPSVAYYRNSNLVGALIGASQNVRLHLERILRGEPIR